MTVVLVYMLEFAGRITENGEPLLLRCSQKQGRGEANPIDPLE
jgi:hypothetical protein